MAAGRLHRQRKLLARAVAKGSPSVHAHLQGLQRAQTVLDNVLCQLINAGVVRIRNVLKIWLPHRARLSRFIQQTTEFFGTEQDWVLELVEGQGSSLASLTYEDRAYFEDLAIFGKPSNPADTRRVLMALFLVAKCPGQISPPPLFYQVLAMLQSSHPGTPPPQFFWSLGLLLQGRVSPPAPTSFSALKVTSKN